MIVVDTNVIAYLFLAGEYSERAEIALQVDPTWAAPLLWRSELRNVLAGYLRKKILTVADCLRIMAEAGRLVEGREYAVPAGRVFEAVLQSGCSAYDCEFVVLAQDLGVPLITADSRILADFPDVAVSLEVFVDR
jgi:predicted nucleic acid-binding protein